MHQLPLAIFLTGPTAIGKTDFAIHLAQKLPVEIISVDSAMIYKGMDIGTGKPSIEEQKIAPHHLIDIRDPSEHYSAACFRKEALSIMNDIVARNRIPLLVGGTFLYIKALKEGLSPLPSHDMTIRQNLITKMHTDGLECLYQKLLQIDPDAGNRINQNDPQRILRALEVYEISGKPMSSFFKKNEEDISLSSSSIPSIHSLFPYRSLTFTLLPTERLWLHTRIEKRFHQMLALGFIEEVQTLYQRQDLNPDCPSMRSVGYRQIWQYLKGELDYDQMIQKSIHATRQLAKRQLTWIRGLTKDESKQNSNNISAHTQHYLKIEENNHLALLQTMINCVFSEAGSG